MEQRWSEPQQQWVTAEVCAVPRQPFKLSIMVIVVLWLLYVLLVFFLFFFCASGEPSSCKDVRGVEWRQPAACPVCWSYASAKHLRGFSFVLVVALSQGCEIQIVSDFCALPCVFFLEEECDSVQSKWDWIVTAKNQIWSLFEMLVSVTALVLHLKTWTTDPWHEGWFCYSFPLVLFWKSNIFIAGGCQ